MKGKIYFNFRNINFICPFCKKKYYDDDEKYLNRLNKNKRCYTRISCQCGKKFGLTLDMTGDIITFDLITGMGY